MLVANFFTRTNVTMDGWTIRLDLDCIFEGVNYSNIVRQISLQFTNDMIWHFLMHQAAGTDMLQISRLCSGGMEGNSGLQGSVSM